MNNIKKYFINVRKCKLASIVSNGKMAFQTHEFSKSVRGDGKKEEGRWEEGGGEEGRRRVEEKGGGEEEGVTDEQST